MLRLIFTVLFAANSIVSACSNLITSTSSQLTPTAPGIAAPEQDGSFATAAVTQSASARTGSGLEAGNEVGKWKRYETSFSNPSWNGNPFDLDFSATFTHVESGKKINQIGFYAGNNTWKIFFMPDALGEWVFTTSSSDPDLDGKSGSFTCVASDLPGSLIGDGNRWKLEDSGEYVAPILLPTREWFKSTETENGIDDFILWAKNTAGALAIGTTLVYFTQGQDEIPYVKGEEGITFNTEMWDRLNSHYDMLRDQGMGFYIMLYSDEAESPNAYGIGPESPEELRLLRYVVARFSAYPIVMWDSGIDIGETRSNDWVNWFADWFNENDPWHHPVSSRSGGGSGGILPRNATYDSNGAATLPMHGYVVNQWKNLSIPLAFTDRWRENYQRGDFDPAKIREAAWEIGLVGGTAVYFGGSENSGYLNENYATDLIAAPELGFRNQFFRDQIIDLSKLTPHDELLVSSKDVILSADPLREYIAYDKSGSSFGINFSGINGTFTGTWFNPRTGVQSTAGLFSGGDVETFTPPDKLDWVLHLVSSDASSNTSLCSSNFYSVSVQEKSNASEILPYLPFRVYLPLSLQCGG